MRVVAVLVLSFVAVQCMPSLNADGQELGQDVDTRPTGTNGRDKTKSYIIGNEKDGIQVQNKASETEERKENEATKLTYDRTGYKDVQDGIYRYLDNDEKKLGLNSDYVLKSAEIQENSRSKPIPGFRYDYLQAVAQKIHNTKVIGTADGNARIVSADQSADSLASHEKPYANSKYPTLAQKFGYSPMSSHYANAQFIKSRYSNPPTRYGSKFRLGTDKTLYQNTQRDASISQHNAGNTQHHAANLQLSPAGWEERARKNAEIRNAKYNIGRETGMDGQHSGINSLSKVYKLDPVVRDAIFSQNAENLLHTQVPSGDSGSAFKLFDYNSRNNKFITVPRSNQWKISYNNNGESDTNSNNENEIKGRSIVNVINNKSWLTNPRDNIKNERNQVKTDKVDSVSSNAASDASINSKPAGENIIDINSTYENTGNSDIATKTRNDKVDSDVLNDSSDTGINSRRIVQGNVEDSRDSYDTIKEKDDNVYSIGSSYNSDTGAKFESSQDIIAEINSGYGNTKGDAAKSANHKDSIDLNYHTKTELNSKDVKENFIGSNYSGYNIFSNKNDEVDSVSSNNGTTTEVMYTNRDSFTNNNNISSAESKSYVVSSVSDVIDVDTNTKNSDSEYPTDVVKSVNNTPSETEAITIKSSQVQNTNEFVQKSSSNVDKISSEYSDEYSRLDTSDNKTISETDELAITTSQPKAKDSSDNYDVSKYDDLDKPASEDISSKNGNFESDVNQRNDSAITDSGSTETSSVNSTWSRIAESNKKANSFANASGTMISKEEYKNYDESKFDDEATNSTNAVSVNVDSFNSESESRTEFGALSRSASNKDSSTVTGKPVSDSFDDSKESTPTPDTVNTNLTYNNTDNSDNYTKLTDESVSNAPISDFKSGAFTAYDDTSVIGIAKTSNNSSDSTTTDRLGTDASLTRIDADSSSDVTSASGIPVIVLTKASNGSVYVTSTDSYDSDSYGSDASETPKTLNSDIYSRDTSTFNSLTMDTANVSTDTPAIADNKFANLSSIATISTLPSSTDNASDLISSNEFVTTTNNDSTDTTALSDSNADNSDTSATATANTNVSSRDDTAAADAASEGSADVSDIGTTDKKTDLDSSNQSSSVSNPARPGGAVSDAADNAGNSDNTGVATADYAGGGTKVSNTDYSARYNGTVDDYYNPITRSEDNKSTKTEGAETKSDESASI